MLSLIYQINPIHIFWGGDFNVVLNPLLDHSSTSRRPHPCAADCLLSAMMERGLVDVWRSVNPVHVEGTCYSAGWGSWSRIDYWLCSRGYYHWVEDVQHFARPLSDHSPVVVSLHSPEARPLCRA